MRRIDIINSVTNIKKAFEDSKIVDFLFTSTEKTDPIAIMESYQKFLKHYDKFGESEKKILDIFGMSGFESSSLWVRIITGEAKESRELIRPFFRGGTYIEEYLIKIVELLKQDNLEYSYSKFDSTVTSTSIDSKEILSVIF